MLVDRFCHLERVRVHDCVAHRDTRTEAVHCAGKNRFLEDGSGTLIESRGELTINTKQIKGYRSCRVRWGTQLRISQQEDWTEPATGE